MAFSLSSWFKGKPGAEDDANPASSAPGAGTAQAPAPPVPTAPTPAAVRTVMPKSAQPVSLRDPGTRQPVSLISAAPPVTTNRVMPVRPPNRKITFSVPSSPRAVAPTPVAVAVPATPPPPVDAPDVAVIIEVGDFIDRIPPNFLNVGPVDRHHKIEFRASELYSDLTKGRASVPASTIYAKYPAIFARPVTDTEDIEVALPLQKLVEQLSAAFQTRSDQVAEENVGEIETPFLQVAKEDSERLPKAVGTVAGAIRPTIPLPAVSASPETGAVETAANFPVRPSHRTGQISTISAPKVPLDPPPAASPMPAFGTPATGPINPGKRPPSTVRASVAGGKIRLSGPSAVTRMAPVPMQPRPPGAPENSPSAPTGPTTASQRIQLPLQPASPASPSLAVSKKTARIQIPPISLRAGGPGAAQRPGAIPPPTPSVPVQPSPVSIRPPTVTDLPVTFRSSPPPPSAKLPPPSFAPAPRPNFPPPAFPAMPPLAVAVPAVPAVAAAPLAPPVDDRKIELGLATVLRGIPSEALTVEPWTIADDVRFSLPFANVEKQLSLGRVSIGVDAFLQALPENFRHVLNPESGLTEIQLPLPEIFQNLPGSALAIRSDQIVEETGNHYPTPFSQKADEDAQRFAPAATVAPPVEPRSAPEPVVAESAPVPKLVKDEAIATASFAPTIEEATPTAPFTDQPLSVTETSVPVMEADQPTETAKDIPLDLGENSETLAVAPAPHLEDAPASKAPAMVNDLPAEPVVEPPAAAELSPLEEALAILESTAPAEVPVPTPEPESQATAAVAQPAPEPEPAPVALVQAPLATAPLKGRDSELQTLFMTEEEIDAKAAVRLVCQLPGVNGCAVMFADGLRLAGNFPEGDPEGFTAMAPPFYKRTQNFVSELKLGGLKAFTVYTENDLLSFFMHDDICVSVRHSGRGFLPGVREKLEIVTRELASIYSAVADHSL